MMGRSVATLQRSGSSWGALLGAMRPVLPTCSPRLAITKPLRCCSSTWLPELARAAGRGAACSRRVRSPPVPGSTRWSSVVAARRTRVARRDFRNVWKPSGGRITTSWPRKGSRFFWPRLDIGIVIREFPLLPKHAGDDEGDRRSRSPSSYGGRCVQNPVTGGACGPPGSSVFRGLHRWRTFCGDRPPP